MKYAHILSEVISMPWAIRPEKLRAIMGFLAAKSAGAEVHLENTDFPKPREPYLLMDAEAQPLRILPVEAAEASAPASSSRSRAGAIAVLPLFGTIANRMGMMSDLSGGTSAEKFTQWFRSALADPAVHSIVIDIESPGGGVAGISELGDEIYQARGVKPVVEVANAQAASAAYWLGSQASEFVVTPSGEVGSIGVFAAHQDVSQALDKEGVKVTYVQAGKYKTEGNPYSPLDEEAKAAIQTKIDAYYNQFVAAVARGRNTTAAKVISDMGQGRMLMAKDALNAGMVDRVATLDRTLQRLGAGRSTIKPKGMAAEVVTGKSLTAAEVAETVNLLADLPVYTRDLEIGAATPADGKTSAAAAGYMELAGAEKDGQCDVVEVAGGVSLDSGMCRKLFDAESDADEFCCEECTHSTAEQGVTNDVDEAPSGAVSQPAPSAAMKRRERLLTLFGR
jgi:signal peptide peptidase SppA